MITFSDFKSKRNEQKEKRISYRDKIRKVSQLFLDTYIKSLDLPSKSFSTSNGELHPYVYIVKDGEALYPDSAFDKARVDLVDGLKFELATAFDDDTQKYQYHRVNLTVYMMSGEDVLNLSVEDGSIFYNIEDALVLNDACEFIKQQIVITIENEQIGKKEKKGSDKRQNIWD